MKIASSWLPFFEEQAKEPYFEVLMKKVRAEYARHEIYPPYDLIFRVFEIPVDKIKVVLIGQDPYHEPGQAQGLSFSVSKETIIPPSLVNIYREIEQEYQTQIYRSGDLSDWAGQGVFLLNQSLTVIKGKAGSHRQLGWSEFIDHLLQYINSLHQPIVFLLLGKSAQSERKWLNNPDHLVLMAAHPSPLSAYRGFFGSGIFKRCNEFLESHGARPIHWTASNIEPESQRETKQAGEKKENKESKESESQRGQNQTAESLKTESSQAESRKETQDQQ